MVAYLDSSVILRHILLGEEAIRHALAFLRIVSSELAEIECRRVLHRYRLTGELTDESAVFARERLDTVLGGLSLLELTRAVKQRAMAAFPVSIRTIDALHIASALGISDANSHAETQVALFSHDRAMNLCARALGLSAPLS